MSRLEPVQPVPTPMPGQGSGSWTYWTGVREEMSRAFRLPASVRSETGVTVRLRATPDGFEIISPDANARDAFSRAVRRAAEQTARGATPAHADTDPEAVWNIIVKPEQENP